MSFDDIKSKTVIAVQARMSSRRFPGKVLTKLQGRTIIEHVLNGVRRTGLPFYVLTSRHESDDYLEKFLEDHGFNYFRGPLDDVLGRFNTFASQHPFTHIVRISADSPLLHPEVILKVLNFGRVSNVDLATNTFPRTFPKGQSVEIISKSAIIRLSKLELHSIDREHVTSYIYDNPKTFTVLNCMDDEDNSKINLCVDYPQDLIRIENWLGKRQLQLSEELPPWAEFRQLITNVTN